MWFSDWIRNLREGKKTAYVESKDRKKKDNDETDEETDEMIALDII